MKDLRIDYSRKTTKGITVYGTLCGVLQERLALLDQHGSSHLPHFGHGKLSRSALAEMKNVINSIEAEEMQLPGLHEAKMMMNVIMRRTMGLAKGFEEK